MNMNLLVVEAERKQQVAHGRAQAFPQCHGPAACTPAQEKGDEGENKCTNKGGGGGVGGGGGGGRRGEQKKKKRRKRKRTR